MKKIARMLLFLGSVAIAGSAMAAVTDTIILRVTPTGTKSVEILQTELDFGSLTLGTTGNINTSSITVTNDGTIVSTWGTRISVADAVWTNSVDMTAGLNEYVLLKLYNGATAPVTGDFNGGGGTEDLVTTTQKLATALEYSDGTETGVDVVPGATRGMWFRLDMPTTSTVQTQRSFTVEIAAL